MAALKARQPHEFPLPPSPGTRKKSPARKGKLKGKEKETVPYATPRKRQPSPRRRSSIAWDWTTLTDSSASTTPPLHTKDGNYFFSVVGSSIRIYSVATGQVVSTLSAPPSDKSPNESNVLTSAILSPWHTFQLITGSLDGRVMVWDFLDATLLQTIDITQPIHHICAHEQLRNSVFVAVSKPGTKNNDDGAVLKVSLNLDTDGGSRGNKSPVILQIGKTRLPSGLAFSPSGTWLVAAAGHTIYVATASSLNLGFVKYVSPERLTCLTFHPFEDYFATGDQKGTIRLWYCLNESLAVNVKWVEKRTQTALFHWHAHAVSSIAFTSNGAYLLSGGEEAVLVIWQLHSGKKEFVPRLGAPINTVSVSKGPGEESYLVGLADATYSFISSGSLRVSRSYSGLKLDPAISHVSPTSNKFLPIAVHSTSSTLILPSSHPSSLQIYSPYSSKLLYELEVSPSNRVSRRDEKPLEPSWVERVAVSPSGQWMATIDVREEDETFHPEIYLKIWSWDQKDGFWILNTRIDQPHGLKKVTDLSFNSSSLSYLVTTGMDGNVKIWGIRAVKIKAGHTEEFWVTRSTFTFRSEVPNSASWSSDASLLAISFGPYVVIYDPQVNGVRQTIISPENQATTAICFIGNRGRYLAIACKQNLIIWDLVLQSVQWSFHASAPIRQMIPHPQDDTFAIFHSRAISSKTTAVTFHVKSCSAVSEQNIPYRFQSIALYAPSSAAFNFVGITTKWAVVSFGEQSVRPNIEGSSSNKISAEATIQKRTLFQDIFGASAFENTSEQPSLQAFSTMPPRSKVPVAAFDGPSHQVPPISDIFDTVMSEFVHTRPVYSPLPSKPLDADEDIDMEVDTPDVLTAARNNPSRHVTQEEFVSLVDLFKAHTVGFKYPTPVANTNGKVNVHSKTKVNGNTRDALSASPPSSTRELNGSLISKTTSQKSSPAVSSSPALQEAATPQQTKKRKKSLG